MESVTGSRSYTEGIIALNIILGKPGDSILANRCADPIMLASTIDGYTGITTKGNNNYACQTTS